MILSKNDTNGRFIERIRTHDCKIKVKAYYTYYLLECPFCESWFSALCLCALSRVRSFKIFTSLVDIIHVFEVIKLHFPLSRLILISC